MQIKIIKGTYGYRPKPGIVRPVDSGSMVDVSDAEADRLVSLGVASYVGEGTPQEAVVTAPPAKDGTGKGNTRSDKGKAHKGPDKAEDDEPPVIEAKGPEV